MKASTRRVVKSEKKTVPSAKEKDVIIVMTKVITLKQKERRFLSGTDFKKRQKNNEKARKDLMKGPQMKNPTLNLRRMLMSVKKKFQKKAQKKSQKLKPSCPLDSINMH